MIIPALIGTLVLGGAFDMHTFDMGQYTQYYIFNQTDVNQTMEVIPRTYTQSQYKFLESSSEANDFLNVAGDIALKIKKNTFSFSGAGGYLNRVVNRERTVEMLIVVDYETKTVTFPSYTKLRTDWQSKPQRDVGTHYIRSITYGGQLIISYQLIAEKKEYMEDIKLAVNGNLALAGSFSGDLKGNFEKLNMAIGSKATVTISASAIGAGLISPPQNLADVFNLVKNYPEMVKKNVEDNGGKETAIKIEIVDLSTLNINYTPYLKNLAMNSILNEANNKYDDIKLAQNLFNNWYDNIGHLPKDKNQMVNEFYSRLSNASKEFSRAISELDPTGDLKQMDKAFKIYGDGGDNIPNRYSRDLQALIHKVEERPFMWYPNTKAVTHYIHWGSRNCTLPSPDPLFIGYAATSDKGFGNGGNMLCLPNDEPGIIEEKLSSDTVVSYINGIGYQLPDESTGQIYCAHCRLENATSVFTVPGKKTCPAETKLEYEGFLMTSPDAGSASRFICLDKNPDNIMPPLRTSPDNLSGTYHPVWIECENCEEDENAKYVSCVVCSR